MFNLDLLKKNIASIIRKEIAEVENRYASRCAEVDDMIINDLSVKREDVAQRQWDIKQWLLNEIYQPYKDELLQFIAVLNRFHNPKYIFKLSPATKSELHKYLLEFYHECKENDWDNTDWKKWNAEFENFIARGMNIQINDPLKDQEKRWI